MKRVALYGGSFDPPHLGHVITITAVLNSKLVDEIWIVPTGLHRDKAHHASPDDRRAMIALMLATMFGSRVPVYLKATQISRPWQVSTTAELIAGMERCDPDHAFFFIVGSDLLPEIPTWHAAQVLMSRTGFFLVVPRLGAEPPEPLPSYAALVPTNHVALTNISSSLVRTIIAEGRSLEGVVPPAVISHIIRNRLYQTAPATQAPTGPMLISEGKFVRFLSQHGWEYVERTNCTGVVLILAIRDDGRLLLTEQYRIPVRKSVIEFPAGLVGDDGPADAETLESAARRELLEETGYETQRVIPLTTGPVSAGLSAELVSFVQAIGLKRRSAGGGDAQEAITVHEVPLSQVDTWLREMEQQGRLVDPKVYAGLYFLQQRQTTPVLTHG